MQTRGILPVNKTLLLFSVCAAAFCVCELGSACLLMLLSLYQVLDLNTFILFIYLFRWFFFLQLCVGTVLCS